MLVMPAIIYLDGSFLGHGPIVLTYHVGQGVWLGQCWDGPRDEDH
jgi:hypothetical protein